MDIRCGFSKQFLDGKLTEKHTSQIWFKADNIIDYSFNFGCGIFVGPQHTQTPFNVIGNLINADNSTDESESSDWKMFRSFFIAVHGSTQLEFAPSSLF